MSSLGNFVWSIADQLRGVYKPHQYGGVILPLTILRRLDCILEPTRDEVRDAGCRSTTAARWTSRSSARRGLGSTTRHEYDFGRLLEDPEGLRANLMDYINGFSPNIDVFERFKFENELATLDEKNRLYLVVSKFAEVDLHPDVVPNAEMGDLFEELIRKFAEASNEEAGEHYTPRDAIRLMVDLLFAEDNKALLEPGTVRTIYDPTAGTGGMLSVAEERLLERNPDARLRLYGQEINDQSYAICKSDMIAKGQDATNIRLGDTLAEDLFFDRTFDFCMSNPPYGVDWKASEEQVKEEAQRAGGRFGHGLPSVGDGQMLFLSHLAQQDAARARRRGPGGHRAQWLTAVQRRCGVGSIEDPALAARGRPRRGDRGAADQHVLQHRHRDIHLDPRQHQARRAQGQGPADRRDQSFWTKMRKNLGAKGREIDADARDRILALYDAFEEADPDTRRSSQPTISRTGRSPSSGRCWTSRPASR